MAEQTSAASAVRVILIVSALFLPTLSLVPLGGLYLYEKGWLLWWALAAAVTIGAVALLQRWMLGRSVNAISTSADADAATPTGAPIDPATALYSPAERRAWQDVRTLARSVDIETLVDSDALLKLGHKTVSTVAHRLHPERADAMWQFTMPEALAITERVSRRLSRFVQETVPFGDRLTIAQVLNVYSWRSVADVAERAYDVWRIIRLANPATAVTNEARERLSRALLQWGRDHVTRRLAERYVEEVGRAAIDLYGGRLRVTLAKTREVSPSEATAGSDDLHRAPMNDGAQTAQAAYVRVLVASSDASVRTDLAAALETHQIASAMPDAEGSGARNPENIAAHGSKGFTLVSSDATPAAGTSKYAKILAKEAQEADILVIGIDRAVGLTDDDLAAASLISKWYAARPSLMAPLLVPVVLSGHNKTQGPDSTQAVSALLSAYGEPATPRVDIALRDDGGPPDVAELYACLMTSLPTVAHARHLRALDRDRSRSDWVGAGRQAISAIGALARSAVSRSSDRPDGQ